MDLDRAKAEGNGVYVRILHFVLLDVASLPQKPRACQHGMGQKKLYALLGLGYLKDAVILTELP
jgi:hypothetical protein